MERTVEGGEPTTTGATGGDPAITVRLADDEVVDPDTLEEAFVVPRSNRVRVQRGGERQRKTGDKA